MENFLRDKDIWILGSVCLVATFLWRRLWKLFSAKKRERTASSADIQVMQQEAGVSGLCTCATCEQVNLGAGL